MKPTTMNIPNAASQLMQLGGYSPNLNPVGVGGNIPNAGFMQARQNAIPQYANQIAQLPGWLQQLIAARQAMPNQQALPNQPVTQGLGAGSAFPGTPPNATDA